MSEPQVVFSPDLQSNSTAISRALASVSQWVGEKLNTQLDEVCLTQKGVSPDVMEKLKQVAVSKGELAWIIKPRTLSHRKHHNELLNSEETGRFLRAAKIHALTVEVLGSPEKAGIWMNKSRKRFGNQPAIELIKSEAGADLVEETLLQMDSGYFA